jgi:cysteine desulfurase
MIPPIYLDYAATTPVDPKVAEKMCACLTQDGNFANPASRSHVYGWRAEEAVENARRQLAELLNTDTREIVWTSGATESNNLAIKGIADLHDIGHIITTQIEHKAVIDPCAEMEKRGWKVTYLVPSTDGCVTAEQVAQAITDDTRLVSVMMVNNELGTINPIKEIAKVCQARNILLHVDAAQAVGKIAVDVKDLGVDLLSLSGHKFYGPKGVGALYVRRGVKVAAQIHGGGHERGMRSGTLPTHQLVGIGEAAEIAKHQLNDEQIKITALRETLLDGLLAIDGVTLHGHRTLRVPGIVNLGFSGLDGETLLMSLNTLAVSTGSACTSASVSPSFVLKALGVSDDIALASIRFSLGRFTTNDDVKQCIAKVVAVVAKLQNLVIG